MAYSDLTAAKPRRTVRILGTHGVPAAYGGFETAAENVALFLVERGWRVIVYCQTEGKGPITEDTWRGIERVNIPINVEGWLGTSKFDWLSIDHAVKFQDVCLTFGYNTGIFNYRLRLHGIPNVINMDGIEWARARWGFAKQAILYVNERFAAWFGNHLIADHPEIERYLWTRAPARKISTITYGAHPVSEPPEEYVRRLGLEPRSYLTLIARPIPENSILELVTAFSRKKRGHRLVVLGKYEPGKDEYHRRVLEAASDEVLFPGGIYDPEIVSALRYHGVGYLHGHTVGGTNPSLVEALAAANPVVAHDNAYNKWVAQDGAIYFSDVDSADAQISELLSNRELAVGLSRNSLARYREEFTWKRVAGQYEQLLKRFVAK